MKNEKPDMILYAKISLKRHRKDARLSVSFDSVKDRFLYKKSLCGKYPKDARSSVSLDAV
ncbi:MAG TPA: hypothetical protein P5123_11940 [Spirochaetota bacterium]|nr:hypothetical protein [Spirochaetota bacterium]